MAAVARGARTNLGLLVLLAIAFATAPSRWSLIIHATSGFAIIALLPWKSMIARRGMRRAQPACWASLMFGLLVVVSLAAGLLQSTGIALSIGPFSAMDFHVGGAIAAVPFAIWHVAARRVRLRPADMSRRAALRGGAVLAGAAAAYAMSEVIVRATALPGATRRFTGSYQAGSHNPDQLPISSWMFDPVPEIDTSSWSLRTPGRA